MSLGVVKITANPNIEAIDPIKRDCLFSHEQPPNEPLSAYQNYSQVKQMKQNSSYHQMYKLCWILFHLPDCTNLQQITCKLECRIKKALAIMKDDERCIPWFLPPVDNDLVICSPHKILPFLKEMEILDPRECEVCQ